MLNNNPQWVDVKVNGEMSGKEYFGRFSIKPYLDHAERADVVRLAELYYRGIKEDAAQKGFLTTLAFLKFHIVETDASWWKDNGLGLFEEAPVYELSRKIREIQNPEKKEEPVAEQK